MTYSKYSYNKKKFTTAVLVCWLLDVLRYDAHAEVAFFGRNLDIYTKMFCLSDAELKNKQILDAAAGPSTFLGILKDKGWLHPDSRALDIAYGTTEQTKSSIMRGMKQAFSPLYDESYKSWPLERQKRFLGKYRDFNSIHSSFLSYYQKYPKLYVQGDVRKLSKIFRGNEKFDWVFSSNLLFLYSDQDLNENFHRDAILSMARVLKENGRILIFPIDNLKASTPLFLNHLLEDLQQRHLKVEVKEGCYPSVGQLIKGQLSGKGQMLTISWDRK